MGLSQLDVRNIVRSDAVMFRLMGYLFHGPDTDHRPSDVQASRFNKLVTTRITCVDNSPIYRFFEHFGVNYNSLYIAWEYAISRHYYIEDILTLHYIEYEAMKDISSQLDISYSTALYYCQIGCKRFLDSYSQQTGIRIPVFKPDQDKLQAVSEVLDKLCSV